MLDPDLVEGRSESRFHFRPDQRGKRLDRLVAKRSSPPFDEVHAVEHVASIDSSAGFFNGGSPALQHRLQHRESSPHALQSRAGPVQRAADLLVAHAAFGQSVDDSHFDGVPVRWIDGSVTRLEIRQFHLVRTEFEQVAEPRSLGFEGVFVVEQHAFGDGGRGLIECEPIHDEVDVATDEFRSEQGSEVAALRHPHGEPEMSTAVALSFAIVPTLVLGPLVDQLRSGFPERPCVLTAHRLYPYRHL